MSNEDVDVGSRLESSVQAIYTRINLSKIQVAKREDLRQYGPGTITLSPSSQTAWITFSRASLAPAVMTMCSGFTGWIGVKYELKKEVRASRRVTSPPFP